MPLQQAYKSVPNWHTHTHTHWRSLRVFGLRRHCRPLPVHAQPLSGLVCLIGAGPKLAAPPKLSGRPLVLGTLAWRPDEAEKMSATAAGRNTSGGSCDMETRAPLGARLLARSTSAPNSTHFVLGPRRAPANANCQSCSTFALDCAIRLNGDSGAPGLCGAWLWAGCEVAKRGGRRCSHEAIAASGPVAAGSLVAARYPAAALAKGLLISIGLLIVGAELSDDHLAGAGFTWKAGRFTTTTLTSARS